MMIKEIVLMWGVLAILVIDVSLRLRGGGINPAIYVGLVAVSAYSFRRDRKARKEHSLRGRRAPQAHCLKNVN